MTGSIEQRITFASAVIGETAARSRCPRNELELGALLGIRLAVDFALSSSLSDEELSQLKTERARTDEVCGIVRVPASAPPEVAPTGEVRAAPEV